MLSLLLVIIGVVLITIPEIDLQLILKLPFITEKNYVNFNILIQMVGFIMVSAGLGLIFAYLYSV